MALLAVPLFPASFPGRLGRCRRRRVRPIGSGVLRTRPGIRKRLQVVPQALAPFLDLLPSHYSILHYLPGFPVHLSVCQLAAVLACGAQQ